MKGDFTRDTFKPGRHYQQVLLQQGRVQLDADWNEQSAIAARRDQTTAADVIGGCGGPAESSAFGLVTDPAKLPPQQQAWFSSLPAEEQARLSGKLIQGDFLLAAGRYYVEGLQCELEQPILYTEQPDWMPAPLAIPVPPATTQRYLVYLNVWQRHLTAVEDPAVREPALGGPDTATRLKTVWQVRAQPTAAADCGDAQADLDALRRDPLPTLAAMTEAPTNETDPCVVPAAAGYRGLENQLYRVEIHDPGKSVNQSAPTDGVPATLLNGNQLDVPGLVRSPGQAVELIDVESDSAGTRVKQRIIAWVTAVSGFRYTLNSAPLPSSTLRARAIEATWKWSRENGSIVFGIQRVKPDSLFHVELTTLPPDDHRGLHAGDWVEVLNDATELDGQPGQLVQVVNPDDLGFVQLSAPLDPRLLPDAKLGANTRLRRWEGVGPVSFQASETQGWLPLESGVLIGFGSNGEFRAGDYWQIPARTASPDAQSGDIQWPRELDATGKPVKEKPLFQPPQGITHHYCRLGIVTVDASGAVIGPSTDCRCLWPALTAVPRLFYVSGDGQEVMPDSTAKATARFKLPQPLIVGVANAHCHERPTLVRFEVLDPSTGQVVSAGGAAASVADVPLDADGLAKCDFLLDGAQTTQQVTARLLDAANNPVSLPIIFNANLSVASQVAYQPGECAGLAGQKTVQDAIGRLASLASLYKLDGDGQQGRAGRKLNEPLRVRVANRCGPVAKMRVDFQVILGGGKVSPTSTITDANGEAICEWELGDESVLQVVGAVVTGDVTRPITDPQKVHFVAHLAAEGGNDPAPVRVVGLGVGDPPNPFSNDQVLKLDELFKGLSVFCDKVIEETTVRDSPELDQDVVKRGQPTCFLTVEVPFPLTGPEQDEWALPNFCAYRPFILHGQVDVKRISDEPPLPDDNKPRSRIVLSPARDAMAFLERVLSLLKRLKPRPDRVLVRLTLKGNFIWSTDAKRLFEQRTPGGFLDGDSFRAPDDPNLLLPSGDNRRGGDFEMWFWVA